MLLLTGLKRNVGVVCADKRGPLTLKLAYLLFVLKVRSSLTKGNLVLLNQTSASNSRITGE